MKNKDLIINILSTREAMKKVGKLKSEVSYDITKNLLLMEHESEPYEKERQKITEYYAEKNENGSIRQDEAGKPVIPEHLKEDYEKDLTELLDIEIDINIRKIKMEDLPEYIEPEILYQLNYMLE